MICLLYFGVADIDDGGAGGRQHLIVIDGSNWILAMRNRLAKTSVAQRLDD